MTVLVYGNLSSEQKEILEQKNDAELQFIFFSELTESEQLEKFAKCEILIGNPPAALFENPHPQLKFWQLDSAGFNQYQNLQLNIPVANMGSFFADRCAETIVIGALAFYRGIHQVVRLQQEKLWKGNAIRKTIQGISSKNVLILGAGAIGLACRRMLTGFGCKITLAARKNPVAQIHDHDDVLKILPTIDLVINTLPGTAVNYVSSEFIHLMKEGAVYANVGRGNTTDEDALIEALECGKLAGAVLDVTAIEPLPTDSKLWDMEQVILTQHSGGGDVHEATGKMNQILANVKRFINNEDLQNLVDVNSGY